MGVLKRNANQVTRRPLATGIAVSLDYDGASTPAVSSVGRGELSAEICKIARRYGIPIRENPRLAEKLAALEVEEQIPAELYREVAELLAALDDKS